MALDTGNIIDNKYEILGLLGEGGMGAVYEGRNILIQRRVAIKVLHASVSAATDIVKRFEREAQAAGRIGSDHIMEVLDLGLLPSGDHYMVLEFLDGETLADRIARKGKLTASELAPLLRQALIGLQAAHQAGIVHRDLKPDNLFILKEKAGRRDYVKIIDFGISKFAGSGGDMAMTSTGAVMGTPYYMSPEQAKGASGVTLLSDVYSMGVIAFEALTGRVPYESTSFNDLMFKIVLDPPPALLDVDPKIDPAFARVVERAMGKDMSARFQSAADFIQAIDEWAPRAETLIGGTPDGTAPTQPPPIKNDKQPKMGTDTSWANTGSELTSERSKRTKVPVIGAAALAVVGLAAGGFAFWGGGDEPDTAPESALVAAPANEEHSDQPIPEPAVTAAAVKATPEPVPAPLPTDEPAQKPAGTPEPPPAKEPTASPGPVAPAQAAPAPAAQPVARPRPVTAPTSRPTQKPKPKPSSTQRRDFGY